MIGTVGDEPLSSDAFYSLYRGALSIADEHQRLLACHATLSMGRLGLRVDELLHLHEGWIDWDRGEIRIPARDPCGCAACWQDAQTKANEETDRTAREIVAEERWAPTDGGARTVSFGWSDRITAVLLALYTDVDVLEVPPTDVHALLEGAARQATGIDTAHVDPAMLRGTAARFFAEAGVDAHSIARLLGTDVDDVEEVVQRWGRTATRTLAERLGTGASLPEPDDLDGRFPVACNPAPFDDEPFDPTGARERRRARADEHRETPTPVENPRPSDPPADIESDVESRIAPAYLDAESTVVRDTTDGPAVTTLDRWVASLEQGRETDRQSAESGTASAETTPTAESGSTMADESGDETMGSTAGTLDGAAKQTPPPRERATEPLVLELSALFAAADLQDGRPMSGRILLGQAELILVTDDEQCCIELTDVSDVALDYTPSGLEETFESTVGISYQRDGDRRLAVVELPGKKQRDVSTAILKTALDDSTVITTHPARVGGRVTDEDPRELTLAVDDRKLEFKDDENETVFNIRLSDLIHVERGRQTIDGDVRKALQIRHCTGEKPTVTEVSTTSDRLFTLLERFVMRDYRRRKQKLRQLTLSPEKKEALVALYSMGDDMDISMIIDRNPDEMEELLGTLKRHGLIRVGDDGTKLTGMGQMVVSDKVDDVNV